MRELHLHRLGRVLRWPFLLVTSNRWAPDATCFGPLVIFWREPWPQLVEHERAHVVQWRKLVMRTPGPYRFRCVVATFAYLVGYAALFCRYGYRNHPWEVQARSWAGEE